MSETKNIYEEMLDSFHAAKGSKFDLFSEENKLDELLNKLSNLKKINDKYGINLDSDKFYGCDIKSEDKFRAIVYMCGGDGYIRMVSEIFNSKDQPESPEMMLVISHPTGAYIFGDYCPYDFFEEFFTELEEETLPKYVDNLNNSLYYPVHRTMHVLDIYDEIYKKYEELNKENYRKEMIRRKRAELEKLEREV